MQKNEPVSQPHALYKNKLKIILSYNILEYLNLQIKKLTEDYESKSKT